jgi:hypothetical protein
MAAPHSSPTLRDVRAEALSTAGARSGVEGADGGRRPSGSGGRKGRLGEPAEPQREGGRWPGRVCTPGG